MAQLYCICGRNCYGIASLDTLQRLVGFSALETVDQIKNNRMLAVCSIALWSCRLSQRYTRQKYVLLSKKCVIESKILLPVNNFEIDTYH